jgi:hypothetical protein
MSELRLENNKERYNPEDLSTDRRIILIWMLWKQGVDSIHMAQDRG